MPDHTSVAKRTQSTPTSSASLGVPSRVRRLKVVSSRSVISSAHWSAPPVVVKDETRPLIMMCEGAPVADA